MNGTTTTAAFRAAILDPAKRAHYRLAWLSTVDHKRIAVSACEKRNVVFISAVAKFVLDLARTFLLPSSPMTLALGFATVG